MVPCWMGYVSGSIFCISVLYLLTEPVVTNVIPRTYSSPCTHTCLLMMVRMDEAFL